MGGPHAQMPEDIKRRLASAHTDKMSLETCDLRLRVFVVRGLTGTYQVVIAAQPRCSCQDYLHRRKNCKHILFVLSRVLGVADGNPVLWQRALAAGEIAAIFARAPAQLRQQSAASTSSLSPCRLPGEVSGAWRDRLRGGQFALSSILGCRPRGSMVVSVDKLLAEHGRVVKEFTYFESPSDFFRQTALCDVKTFHEVIEAGAWAKLYFDVEHYVSAQHDPDKIAECLAVIKERLLRDFVCVQNDPAVLEDVIILTSSRAAGDRFKHSYHLVFPQIYFQGLVLMRNFVRTVAGDRRLQAWDSKGGAKSMIDTKVYNMNQSLRLIESWKIDPLHGTQVPLRYADDRAPVTLSDLVRTVVSHDDGEDCVRIREEDDSEGGDEGLQRSFPAWPGGFTRVIQPHETEGGDEGLQRSFPAWPGGFTRVIRHNESDAFAWMQINCGEAGGERLEALRKHFAGRGYMHFLHVRWRKGNKKYLYAWTGTDDMVRKAREIHTALRELRGSYLKDFSLGAKINNHGTESWVQAGHIIADSALGYLSEDDLDELVSRAPCVVAGSVATPGKAREDLEVVAASKVTKVTPQKPRDEAVTPQKAREDLEVVAASKVTKVTPQKPRDEAVTPQKAREDLEVVAASKVTPQKAKTLVFDETCEGVDTPKATDVSTGACAKGYGATQLSRLKMSDFFAVPDFYGRTECTGDGRQHASLDTYMKDPDYQQRFPTGLDAESQAHVEGDLFAEQRPSASDWMKGFDKSPANDRGVVGAPEQTVVMPDEDDDFEGHRPSASDWMKGFDKSPANDRGVVGAPEQTVVMPDEDDDFEGHRPSASAWLQGFDKSPADDRGVAEAPEQTVVIPDEDDDFEGHRPSASAWLQGFDKSPADDRGVAEAPEQTVVMPDEDDDFEGHRPSASAWLQGFDKSPADDRGVAEAPDQTVVIPDEDDDFEGHRPSELAWLGCSDKTPAGDAGNAGAPEQTVVISDDDDDFAGQRPSALAWLGCSDKTPADDRGVAGTAGKTGVVIQDEEEEDDDDNDMEGEVSSSNTRDTRGRQERAQKQTRGNSKEGKGSSLNSKDTRGGAQKRVREEGEGSSSNSKDTRGGAQKRPRAGGGDADGVRKKGRKLCPHNRRRYVCVECGGAGICEHGRERLRCKDCGGASICEHQRRKEECVECGGSRICIHKLRRDKCRECMGASICVHKLRRDKCRECMGASMCVHKRQRNKCKECEGASICVHKRQRNNCTECGGASICVHKRRRAECKECRGASMCVHKRQRNKCKECGGASICVHKRQRNNCTECGGASICVHKRRRAECKECGGASICIHKRQRNKCKECMGASICVHNRQRAKCKECGGNGICEHGRQRNQCKDCLGGSVCPHRNLRHRCKLCPLCCICKTSVAGYGEKSSMCLACFRLHAVSTSRPNENALKEYLEKKARLVVKKRDVRKKDEMELKAFLEEMPGLEIVVHDNAVMGADSACPGAKLRPDFQVSSRAIREHLSLWVECDEDAHRSPEYSCELARIWKMYSAVMWKYRVHVVRWNPHAFATGFKASREKFPKERRYEILKKELDRIIKEAQEQPPDFLLKITYICYDCSCGSADACGFVHHRTYMTEEEVQGDLEREL